MELGDGESVVVVAPTRLHFALLDCGNATPRRFGGLGVALSDPRVVVQASPGDELRLEGFDGDRQASQVAGGLRALLGGLKPRVEITLLESPKRHVGLGTGTATVLAAMAACSRLLGVDATRSNLQSASGRGAASGVGIHSFFQGGCVFDGGHRSSPDQPHLPSGAARSEDVPPLLMRFEFPAEWEVWLLLSRGEGMSGAGELSFFERTLPTARIEALNALAIAYHGVAPALAEGDLNALAEALRQLHQVGFKNHELLAASANTQQLVTELQRSNDVAAGMSSLGPLVYAIIRRDDRRSRLRLEEISLKYQSLLSRSVAASSGYQIHPSNDLETTWV